MILNDVTTNTMLTSFYDLKVGDCFIQNPKVIWMKTDTFDVDKNAIQITDNDHYVRYGIFKNNTMVEKIEITSIDYRRIK